MSRRGRLYGDAVEYLVRNIAPQDGTPALPIAGHLSVVICAFPPDRRRRDLDNLLKATLDALARAGVYEDDSQIKRIEMEWGPCVRDGSLAIKLSRFVANHEANN